MAKRLITGLFIIIAVAGFTALRMVHLAFFDAFVFALMIASGFEMIHAKKQAGKVLFERLIILFPIPATLGFVFGTSLLMSLTIVLLSIAVIFILSVGIELIIYGVSKNVMAAPTEPKQLLSITKETMGVIIYPLTLISTMMVLNHIGYELGFVAIITMFAITMTTDTFAYLVGMIFGRKECAKKLAPTISPKKSMAGFYGGLVGGIIISMVCWILFYHLDLLSSGLNTMLSTALSLTLFSMCGILASLATQFGDLLASAIKREADIKDFSNLLPGHGGIMDRIDGEMFSSTIVAAMFMLFILL